ncbi:MAG: 6-bladed beta-propeller [Chloroflexota bacterium]|nr:6-bladed beta-propeller [Chloroflexota bacterium]
MAKLNEQFPERMLDPTAATRGYIAKASGARDAARNLRTLRNLARRSANPSTAGSTQTVDELPDDPNDMTPGIIYQVLGASGEADRLVTAIVLPDGTYEIRDINQPRDLWPAAYGSALGSLGLGNNQFGADSIRGIAVDSAGNIYVSSDHRVQKFGVNRTWLATIATLGSTNGLVNEPSGLWFTPGFSDLHIADAGNNRIQVFSNDNYNFKVHTFNDFQGSIPAGPFRGSVRALVGGQYFHYSSDPTNGWVLFHDSAGYVSYKLGAEDGAGDERITFTQPWGMYVFNKILYVVDRSRHDVTAIELKAKSRDNKFLHRFGGFGSSNGQFNNPHSVAIDAQGNIHVTDSGNNRVQVFSPQGVFLGKYGAPGAGAGQFANPTAIAITDETIYVADSGNNRVQVWTSPSVPPESPVVVGTYNGTWEPGIVNTGGQKSQTVTIAGALKTDSVLWGHDGVQSSSQVQPQLGFVESADLVTVRYRNHAGADQTVGSGSLNIIVVRDMGLVGAGSGGGSGGGDVSSNTTASVTNELTVFSGPTGKLVARATGSGLAKLAAGVLSVVAAPTGAVVGTTDAQTLAAKTLTTPTIGDLTNANHAHAGAASGGIIPHGNLSGIGANSHAAIDTHLGAANPHSGSAATVHTHAAADVTSGVVATARLGTGVADLTTFLRGDQTWATPSGGGGGGGSYLRYVLVSDGADGFAFLSDNNGNPVENLELTV